MPKEIEHKLQAEAQQKFPRDKKRQNAYVYGTLRNKFGWTPLKIRKKAEKASKEK